MPQCRWRGTEATPGGRAALRERNGWLKHERPGAERAGRLQQQRDVRDGVAVHIAKHFEIAPHRARDEAARRWVEGGADTEPSEGLQSARAIAQWWNGATWALPGINF